MNLKCTNLFFFLNNLTYSKIHATISLMSYSSDFRKCVLDFVTHGGSKAEA